MGRDIEGRWVTQIEQDTERLRSATDPTLRRLRDVLAQKGVTIGPYLVANLMPEDTDMLSGILVTHGRVYEFELDWKDMRPEEAQLTAWRDLTDTYQSRAFREPIDAALSLTRRMEQPA